MRAFANGENWHAGYLADVRIALEELQNALHSEPKTVYCDVYALPADNHQTFYCRAILENGFTKLEYAKPVQNSIWFSSPIYMYHFADAKEFSGHPVRKGKILCGKKIIKARSLEHLLSYADLLCEEQPEDIVIDAPQSVLTVIRIYENNEIAREIAYTEPSKLRFKDGEPHQKLAEIFKEMHLLIEKIIGVGIS